MSGHRGFHVSLSRDATKPRGWKRPGRFDDRPEDEISAYERTRSAIEAVRWVEAVVDCEDGGLVVALEIEVGDEGSRMLSSTIGRIEGVAGVERIDDDSIIEDYDARKALFDRVIAFANGLLEDEAVAATAKAVDGVRARRQLAKAVSDAARSVYHTARDQRTREAARKFVDAVAEIARNG